MFVGPASLGGGGHNGERSGVLLCSIHTSLKPDACLVVVVVKTEGMAGVLYSEWIEQGCPWRLRE